MSHYQIAALIDERLAAQPSDEPGLDVERLRTALTGLDLHLCGGHYDQCMPDPDKSIGLLAAALTPDRPTPRVGCFPQAHRYDRIGVTDRLRCRRCGFEKPG